MLQNQHPEHEDDIERLRPGDTVAGLPIYPDELVEKGVEVDLSVQCDQRTAQRCQLRGAVIPIEESRLAVAEHRVASGNGRRPNFLKQNAERGETVKASP